MSQSSAAKLRSLISSARDTVPIVLPGAPNALTARIIEQVGFEAVYLSGAGIANTFLGVPDIGLLTQSELVSHVSAVREAVELPLVVDGNAGFGNAINAYRTVRLLEAAGAAAIQIEDQTTPKRCGHFDGKEVVSQQEMMAKIAAATDARRDDNVVIIARTDALETEGVEAACERVNAYREVGADLLFVEAPRSIQEVREIAERVNGPLIINYVEGGRTPILPLAELHSLGYVFALYANIAMRAGMKAQQQTLEALLSRGDSLDLMDDIATWQGRQDLVNKPFYDELSLMYSSTNEDWNSM